VNVEVHMKPGRFVLVVGCVALLTAACHRTIPAAEPATETATLDRSCAVAAAADAHGNQAIADLQGDLRARRSPAHAAEHLGYRFIAQARLTNDPGYYTVAEQAAACLETVRADDPAALLLRGHVLHQLHRFAEAEAVARRLVAQREFVLDFGLLGDALMEQGRLSEAAAAYQKMIDLKPFYQSYTRAAHLRWLRGDLAGAIALMHNAVKAASPRDPESIAWAYTRLATYQLQAGRLTEASAFVDSALQYVPDYAAALLLRGRLLIARQKDAEAVEVLVQAARLNPLPEYQWTLADTLRRLGRGGEAAAIEQALVGEAAASDPRTLALYLSTRRTDVRQALELARREMEHRRDVFTLDSLAWALASSGQLDEASVVMTKALAEGTQDARLFVHAAAIAAAGGRPAEAARFARKAHTLRFTLLPSELDLLRRVS
jgi:tetratricopeptide (TPR) repeat protein